MTGLAAYAVHEAEMEIARATAVRALTQTGATRDEAEAAVCEHLLTPEARGRIGLALSCDLLALSTVRLGLEIEGFRAGLDRARAGLITLRQLLVETGLYAWVERNPWPMYCPSCEQWATSLAGKRMTRGASPRTIVRCEPCRVQWRYGRRVYRRSARWRTPGWMGPALASRWVGARR